MKTICSSILIVLLFAFPVYAWESGASHHYVAYGVTGGGNALDGISGVSIGNADMCIVYSGTTVQFYRAHINTGSTVESSPTWITPDDLQAGGTGSGTTMWRFLGVSGDTVWANAFYVDVTRWDDGSGGLDNTLVRAGVTPTVFDKSTDELGQIISGVSDQFLAHNGTAWVVVDPASAREALGTAIGSDVQAWDADLDDLADGTLSKSKVEDSGNWDTAYGWGDHSTEGYLTGVTDHSALHAPGGDWDLSPYYLTGTTNHATSHEAGGDWEMQLSDMASGVSDIMDKTGDAGMISDWDTAYGWGDHSVVGYLTGTTNHAALHEAGGAWELDIGNLASGTSRVFDKSTDTIINIDGTAWRVIYTDASGDVTELALGANGEYLKSQGAAAAPTWDTPAGGGGGGSGLTTIQTSDGTEAIADALDDAASGIFIKGKQGIETTATGQTVYILADNVHSQVTAYIAAQDFLTEETDSTALSELTDHTAANTTTGVSIFDGDYDADILIYDTDAGTWSAQSVDGDATIDDTGTLSIANGAVSDDEIDYGTVTVEDFTNDAGYLTTATDLSAPSGVTEQSAVTAFKCWTIISPDEMVSGATEVPIWTVNESQFPRGIMLVSVSAEVTSGTTGYTIVYEEWTDSHQNDIESITCTNGAQTEVERGNIDHRVIEANRRIYLDVPSTKAYSVHGCFGYYPR